MNIKQVHVGNVQCIDTLIILITIYSFFWLKIENNLLFFGCIVEVPLPLHAQSGPRQRGIPIGTALFKICHNSFSFAT